MADCRECGTPNVYNSGFSYECSNRKCSWFTDDQLEAVEALRPRDTALTLWRIEYQGARYYCCLKHATPLEATDLIHRVDGTKLSLSWEHMSPLSEEYARNQDILISFDEPIVTLWELFQETNWPAVLHCSDWRPSRKGRTHAP